MRTADALAAAGVAEGGAFDLDVTREGGACVHYSWPATLWSVHVETAAPLLQASLLAASRSFVYSSVVTSLDCEADSSESSFTRADVEADTPLPTTQSVPSFSGAWTLQGGTLGLSVTHALPTLTDACDDGSTLEEGSGAGLQAEVMIEPLAPLTLTLTTPGSPITARGLGVKADRASAIAGTGATTPATVDGDTLRVTVTPPQVAVMTVSVSAASGDGRQGEQVRVVATPQ